MATLDTLLTKTGNPTTAGTPVYPTGPITVGGSSVDEFDVHKTPIDGCWLKVHVPVAVVGTGAQTLIVSIDADDNTSFSSAVNRTLGRTITEASGPAANGVGTYLFPIPYINERYIRVKTAITGTSGDWGTVTFAIVPADLIERYL